MFNVWLTCFQFMAFWFAINWYIIVKQQIRTIVQNLNYWATPILTFDRCKFYESFIIFSVATYYYLSVFIIAISNETHVILNCIHIWRHSLQLWALVYLNVQRLVSIILSSVITSSFPSRLDTIIRILLTKLNSPAIYSKERMAIFMNDTTMVNFISTFLSCHVLKVAFNIPIP